ncbi:MAG: TonB-dependent receptor [Gammaproteobacteria bacterium]|nr:TonB-dependent receptor [Gammaproteobacteria bacterium]
MKKFIKLRHFPIYILISFSPLTLPIIVFAQEPVAQLEEITVTATRTGETDLQETSIAITTFDSTDLFERNITNTKDLSYATPGMSMGQNANYAQIFIRGVGTDGVFPGSETSSTVHYDGVYMSRPTMLFNDFLDIERVEVLKGPQGTLYGRNSVGGTINITPYLPTNEHRTVGSVELGNYGRTRVAASVSGPVVEDTLMASLSVIGHNSDGYVKNANPNGTDYFNDENREGIRGSLRWLINDQLEFILSSDYLNQDESPPMRKPTHTLTDGTPANTAQVINDPWKIDSNFDSTTELTNYGTHGKLIWDIDEDYQMTSITAYRGVDYKLHGDTDYTEINDFDFSINEEQTQFSQELQLTKKTGRLTWLAGLYYFDEDIDVDFVNNTTVQAAVNRNFPAIPVQAILDAEVNTTSWAAFFHGSYALTDQLSVIFGSRYTDEEKTISGCPFSSAVGGASAVCAPDEKASLDESASTPKVGLEYQYNEDLFYYGTISKGYKSGGFNFGYSDPVSGQGFSHPDAEFDPEYLIAYEVGMKSNWLNNRLRINGALFFYDYEDLQILSFINNTSTIGNADESEATGAELEITYAPTNNWRFDAGFSWLDAKYTDYKNASEINNNGPITIDATHNTLNKSPKWTSDLTARYYQYLPSGNMLTWRVNHYWQEREYFSSGNVKSKSQEAYGITNISLGYSSLDEKFEVLAYVDNVTDEDYFNGMIGFNLNSGLAGDINPPRTYGIKAIYHFE